MEDIELIIIFVTADLTGAFIYTLMDPQGNHIFNQTLYENDGHILREKPTFWNYILSMVFHPLFIVSWMMGLANITGLMKKGMYFNKLKRDVNRLGRCIDAFLFSEMEKLEEEEIDNEINDLERLFNEYGIMLTWQDRLSPYDIKYSDRARRLFKKRIKMKLR